MESNSGGCGTNFKSRPVFRKRYLSWFIWAAGIVSIVLVSLESALRVFFLYLAPDSIVKNYAPPLMIRRMSDYGASPASYKVSRYLGYAPTPNYPHAPDVHNSLGFRSPEIILPKPAGEFRIACVGGSTTYGTCVADYASTWPGRLQERLLAAGHKVTVINAGVNLYTSHESVINYALRCSSLDLDMLLIYDGVNDIVARMVWPPEAYRGDNSGMRSAYGDKNDFGFLPFGLCVAYLPALLFGMGNDAFDAFSPTWRLGEYVTMKSGGRPGIFKHVTLRQMLDANKPVYFARNLKHLVSMANGDHVTPVLMTYVYPRPDFAGPLFSDEGFQHGYRETNDTIRAVAAETDTHLVDADASFPIGMEFFCGDFLHFNDEGEAKLAEIVADNLLAHDMIKAPL